MPKDTKHRSFRLSTKAVAMIEQMAEAEACSHTAIVERAVRMLDIALNGPGTADPAARALDRPAEG